MWKGYRLSKNNKANSKKMTIDLTHLETGGTMLIYSGGEGKSPTKRAWTNAVVLEYSDAITMELVAKYQDLLSSEEL